MTIGFGILFKDKAFLCIDSCEYTPEKNQFNYYVTKYYKLSDNLFYIEGGLSNTSDYVIKKLHGLGVDSFDSLKFVISGGILPTAYNEFLEVYIPKHPDILKSSQFNYYTVIFAGRKDSQGLFLATINFFLTDTGKVDYRYSISEEAPALFVTPVSNPQETDQLYKKIQNTKHIKELRKAVVKTVEKLAQNSPFITQWGSFIELDSFKMKVYPFNSGKKIHFFLRNILFSNKRGRVM